MGISGSIEGRLAELEAQKPPRVKHVWKLERKGGLGEPYLTGDYTCALCGGWMSGIRNPKLYADGCRGKREEVTP